MVQGALTFVMLDVVPPTGPLFEASKPQGTQAEQSRSYRFLHDKWSPMQKRDYPIAGVNPAVDSTADKCSGVVRKSAARLAA
jgi:hypothetical protein